MKTNDTMLLRAGTMSGSRRLVAAGKHVLRETGGPNIDDQLSGRNIVLAGPDEAARIGEAGTAKMRAAGIDPTKYRKNGTRAAEIIFGLPASTDVNIEAYFRDCLRWVGETFGDVVLSAVVHLDESAPHMHVLMAPMKAGVWMASAVFGRRQDIKALQDDFFRRVASWFGVQRAPERLRAADRRNAVRDVLEHLRATSAPVIHCQTWPVVRDAIEADPRPWAEQLGVPINVRLKTLAQLKVSAGRGSKRESTWKGEPHARGPNSYPVVDDPSEDEIYSIDDGLECLQYNLNVGFDDGYVPGGKKGAVARRSDAKGINVADDIDTPAHGLTIPGCVVPRFTPVSSAGFAGRT